jgi:hypothetical protein
LFAQSRPWEALIMTVFDVDEAGAASRR